MEHKILISINVPTGWDSEDLEYIEESMGNILSKYLSGHDYTVQTFVEGEE